MTSAIQKEIRSANEEQDKLVGPKSFYDRWLQWRSQSEVEAKRQAIAEELTKFLNAEYNPYPTLLRTDNNWCYHCCYLIPDRNKYCIEKFDEIT